MLLLWVALTCVFLAFEGKFVVGKLFGLAVFFPVDRKKMESPCSVRRGQSMGPNGNAQEVEILFAIYHHGYTIVLVCDT